MENQNIIDTKIIDTNIIDTNIMNEKFQIFSDNLKEIYNEIINVDYTIYENEKLSINLNNLINIFASNILLLEKLFNTISDNDIFIIKDTLLNFLYLVNPKNIIQFIPDDMKAKIAENINLNTKTIYDNIDCKLSLFPDSIKNNAKDLLFEIKGKNVVDVLEDKLGNLNNISESAKKAIPYLDNLVNGNNIKIFLINEINKFNYEEFKKFIIDFLKNLLLDDNLQKLQNEIDNIFGNIYYHDINNIDDILLYIFKYLQFGKYNILSNFDVKVLIGIFSVPSLLFLINIPKSNNIGKYIINTLKPSFMTHNVNWYTYIIIFLQYFNILLIFLRVTFNDEIYNIIKILYKELNNLTFSDEVTYQIIKFFYMYNVKYLVGILYILGITLSLINFKNEESHNISIVRAFLTIFFIMLIPELFFEKILNSFSSNNYSLNILIKILTTLIVIYILDKSIVIITDSFKLYTNLGDKDKHVCDADSSKHADYAESAKYAKYADSAKYAKYAENTDNIVDSVHNNKIYQNKKDNTIRCNRNNTVRSNRTSDILLMIRFISIIIFAVILQQFNLNKHIQFNDNENLNTFIQIASSIIIIVIFDYLLQSILIPLQINIKSTSKINVNYKLIVVFIVFFSLMLIGQQYSKKIGFVKIGDKHICIV